MIEIVNMKIDPFERDDFVFYWEILNSRSEDITNFEVRVLRSRNKNGDYKVCLGWKPANSISFFRDRRTTKNQRWVEISYKIEVKKLDTNIVEVFGPASLEREPTSLDKMIIRNQRNQLFSRGRDVIIFKKPEDGIRCTCFNETLGDFDVFDCNICGGSGYQKKNSGVFFSKIFFPQENRSNASREGKEQHLMTGIWLSNYPIMSSGDMIVDKRNDRYIVNDITVYNPRDVIIRQELQLAAVKKTSTLMSMPIPEDFKKL